ncbi:hypothetical protein [Cellulomonas sp. P24]|uniref:hypothetical protein n=1 Tax=Cellulomonas sp. P24 TaxID=2885206 RepID=UPI00216B2783|nr:hypothetical protein [Cellulomonas sp. P24]MCR6493171.1 hypothetical protein [Cellulomonas sp. P24]
MDLQTALNVVSSTVQLSGVSDRALAAIVQGGLRTSRARPLSGLDGGIRVRAVDILHELALATRFSYHPTVLDAYSQWALLRYIGAFDLTTDVAPKLELSDAGQRVIANQRRVMSEELGIGVSVLLARRWFQRDFPASVLDVVDLDLAVESGLVDSPAGRRADYLLASVDPSTGHLLAHGLLESKGTVTPSYHVSQITSGAGQVENTTVEGRHLTGLVGGSLTGRHEIRYGVIEVIPRVGRRPIDLGEVARQPGVRIRPPSSAQMLRRASAVDLLRSTWTKLAEIADDPELFSLVAPERLKERRAEGMSRPRGERIQKEVGDVNFVGTMTRVPLPGGELRAFLGVDALLLTALRTGEPEAVAEVQGRARRLGDTQESLDRGTDDRVASVTATGTALIIEAH